MKQHRTKEQKLRAEQRRETGQIQYSFRDQSTESQLPEKNHVRDSVAALFPYDTALIYRDLRKTAMIITVLFCVLFSVYWYIIHFS